MCLYISCYTKSNIINESLWGEGEAMFKLFQSREEDIELFKKKIDELNNKLDEREHAFQIFLNDLHH